MAKPEDIQSAQEDLKHLAKKVRKSKADQQKTVERARKAISDTDHLTKASLRKS